MHLGGLDLVLCFYHRYDRNMCWLTHSFKEAEMGGAVPHTCSVKQTCLYHHNVDQPTPKLCCRYIRVLLRESRPPQQSLMS